MPAIVPRPSLYRQMGIYLITNTLTGHAYIGCSTDIGRRWCQHKTTLRSQGHTNKLLQSAWDADGSQVFTCRVIETVPSADLLLAREEHHIAALAPAYNGSFAVQRQCRLGPRTTEEEHAARFWGKVEKREDGCWVWTGNTWDNGTREKEMKFGVHGAKITARRYAYQLVNGPPPAGYHVFKTCETPQCVNPAHSFAQPAIKQTCKRGHPRTGHNLMQSGSCRQCQKMAGDRSRARKQAAKAAL